MSRAMQIVIVATALGSGLTAGLFFAFSTFIMSRSQRIPHPQGIAAMQSINRTVVNPLVMTALFGTAPSRRAAAVCGRRGEDVWRTAGGAS
jgi:uncharacterized membrane protein